MVCCYISFIYTLSTGYRQQTNYYGVFDKSTNFSCNEKCSDESRLYAGDIEGKPGENFMEGERANSFLLGRTVQPKGGGGFTPTLQIMDRGDGLVDTAAKGWPYEGKECKGTLLLWWLQ